MKELFTGIMLIVAVIWGCTLSPPSDFAIVDGKKLPLNGYEKNVGKFAITVVNGIYKSSSSRLEQEFTVGHLTEKEATLNVIGTSLDAKGKRFEGKILSTVFNENSKFPPRNRGHFRIEWNFDESGDKLLAQGFAITFKIKLDGKEETATVQFAPTTN
jgi:hypothetical protein